MRVVKKQMKKAVGISLYSVNKHFFKPRNG